MQTLNPILAVNTKDTELKVFNASARTESQCQCVKTTMPAPSRFERIAANKFLNNAFAILKTALLLFDVILYGIQIQHSYLSKDSSWVIR